MLRQQRCELNSPDFAKKKKKKKKKWKVNQDHFST
jgi:hypothetical protein